MEVILFAIPFFFALILIELVAEKVRGTHYYRVNDSVTSLTTGVLNQAVGVVKLLVPLTLYVWVYNTFALWQLSDRWELWVLAFVLYDFCYYWNHRLGHEMNLLWAAHVVHHNSEDYNLGTALRQTGTSFFSVFFYLPMAIVGFDPLMVVTVGALNLVYQFWVHTQHIRKLGVLDRIFITPSNHRVHHAQNAVYIDRNYGGVFILWDRLFGSFQEELDQDPPIFGIRGALNSWNPLWANFQIYHQLWQDCLHTQNWWHKISLWFRRTGWRPPDVIADYPHHKTDLSHFQKFDTENSTAMKCYALLQYVLISSLLLMMMLNLENVPAMLQLGIVTFLIFSGYSVSRLLEARSDAFALELIKILFLGLALAWLPLAPLVLNAIVMLAAMSLGLLAYLNYRKE